MMDCVEITKFGGPDVLVATKRPKPDIRAGEILIRVHAAGVNRPDVVQRLGMYPPPPGASDIPGLEVAGEIVALGAGVDRFMPGDAVCALVTGGGYAEYVSCPAALVLPVPAGLSFAEAAAIPETFFTVWSNVFERGFLAPGEWLLVHGGSSGIGSTAIQLAKAFDARVVTTVGSAEKADFCRSLGADHTVNYKETDFVKAVGEVTDGRGVDVVLDMVGGDYIARNIDAMAVGGRHVSIAFLRGPQAQLNMLPVMLKRLLLTGSTLRARELDFKTAIAEALLHHVWPLLEAGQVKPQIFRTFPFEDAASAHALMETSDHMGKLVLLFE